jgi:hypothetical protein
MLGKPTIGLLPEYRLILAAQEGCGKRGQPQNLGLHNNLACITLCPLATNPGPSMRIELSLRSASSKLITLLSNEEVGFSHADSGGYTRRCARPTIRRSLRCRHLQRKSLPGSSQPRVVLLTGHAGDDPLSATLPVLLRPLSKLYRAGRRGESISR